MRIRILQQQIVNSYDDASSDTELDTSVFDGMRIVCEGGHKSWIAGMLATSTKTFNTMDRKTRRRRMMSFVMQIYFGSR